MAKRNTEDKKDIEMLKKRIVESEDAAEREDLLAKFEKAAAKRSVRPMHFCIEEKDVTEHYDAGAFTLSMGGGYIHYMTKGGFSVFVSPNYSNLYNTLDLWLRLLLKNKGTELEHSEEMEGVSDFLSSILFAPTVVFAKDEYMFKTFEMLTGFVKEQVVEAQELLGEDHEENMKFENGMKAVEQTSKMLEDFIESQEKEKENR